MLTTSDSALKIGSGTAGDIRNIVFTDCVVKLALRGVDIMARDGGDIENVTARNIDIRTHLFAQPWWGASEAVYITAIPRTVGVGSATSAMCLCPISPPKGEAGVFIRGTAPGRRSRMCRSTALHSTITKLTSWPSRIDLRPTEGWRGPLEKGVVIAAFDLQDVRGIILRNSEVRWAPNPPPEFGPLIHAVRVTGMLKDNVRGTDAHPPARAP